MGMALRGYYTSARHDEPWIDSHLDIRDPQGEVVPGYGWIFPLGDGRVNVGVGLLSTGGAWKGVNTTKLQEYFVSQTAEAWDSTTRRAGARRPADDFRWAGARARRGPNTLTIGDAAGTVNPFNGEGIAYGYETGRVAAAVVAKHCSSTTPRSSASTTSASNRPTVTTTRSRERSCASSQNRGSSRCASPSVRVEPLMNELLAIMANLTRHGKKGPAEVGYRASFDSRMSSLSTPTPSYSVRRPKQEPICVDVRANGVRSTRRRV